MIRLLFTNNYDTHLAREGWNRGTYPAHHLFGTAYLGHPFHVVDVRCREDDLAAWLTRYSRGLLGDLGVQLRAASRIRQRSIIYAAQAGDLIGMAVLRRQGVIRVPIVGVFHGVSHTPLLGHASLAGFDRAIALSHLTRDALVEGGMPADLITVLNWGPDLEFPAFAPGSPAVPTAPVVSTGKTGRDLKTLIEALRRTGSPARVYASRESLAGVLIPEQVELRAPVPPNAPAGTPFTYAHALQDLRSAAVVAIPLRDPYPLHGLTELADAIACARPVIVTRAPYFDLDVESVGCGWWVEEGDVDGWAAAITEALSDRDRLAAMGRAGHRWAAGNWNARLFADGVRQILLEVDQETYR
jgi:glycosyltransferase involved in cell wall biosynthesis